MRRFTLLLGIVVALGLCGTPAALAANPEVNHFTFSDSVTDPDFCGTGQTVEISASGHGTEFFAPNQPVDYRNVFEGSEVYTNPQNGATVVSHVAAQLSDTIISGDPEGVSTHEIRFIGLTRLLRTADGDVLVGGAGYLVLHQVINADGEVISTEIVVDRGPHPIAESDFALFCDFMTDALGLS
jgi:hypothetical protein